MATRPLKASSLKRNPEVILDSRGSRVSASTSRPTRSVPPREAWPWAAWVGWAVAAWVGAAAGVAPAAAVGWAAAGLLVGGAALTGAGAPAVGTGPPLEGDGPQAS